jgi:RNA polymerase sigma factor (sigma-70 family)
VALCISSVSKSNFDEPFIASGIPLGKSMLVAEPELELLPVEQAIAGDPEAWDTLFRRYQLPLYTFVFGLVHDHQVSLDIVQDTFISALRHVGSLRDPARFGSWLFGIAHQKSIQRWRKQSREEVGLDHYAALPNQDQDDPADLLIRKEQSEAFLQALDELPPTQRATLLLFFLEGFSIEEIATITGSQPGTVKSRLFYGKQTIRNKLNLSES